MTDPTSHRPTAGRPALPPLSARQRALTDQLICYYAAHTTTEPRPHCQGVAVVAYGPIVLCEMCNKMRSTVGRFDPPRTVPGPELSQLIAAASVLAQAEAQVACAVGLARAAGASWSQVGDAVGISRQGAQQRWGTSTREATTDNNPLPT